MPLPWISRPGTYYGTIEARKLDVTSKSGCAQFVALCRADRREMDGNPDACEVLSPPQRIFGYMVLMNRSGEPNKTQIESLARALRWNGTDYKALNNIPIEGLEIQMVVKEGQDLDGNPRMVLEWINSPDAGFRPSDEKIVSAIDDVMNGRISREQYFVMAHKPDATAAAIPPSSDPAAPSPF
jgi:hypothetical protein